MSYGCDLEDLKAAHVAGILASVSATAFLVMVTSRRTSEWRWISGLLGFVTSVAIYVLMMSFAAEMIGGVNAMATILIVAPLLALATLAAWACCVIGARGNACPAGKAWWRGGSAALIGSVLFVWATAEPVEAIACAVVALPTIGMTHVLCSPLNTRGCDTGDRNGTAVGANR